MRRTTVFTGLTVCSLLAGAASLAGCGAISNAATITFALPAQSFSFDTSSSTWKAPPASFPSVTCGPGGMVADCCQAPADCNATPLACVGGVCVLDFPIDASQTINLKMQVPSLSSL